MPHACQVCASRTFNVLPIVEHCYDLGNLAAVCRSADGALAGVAGAGAGASANAPRFEPSCASGGSHLQSGQGAADMI